MREGFLVEYNEISSVPKEILINDPKLTVFSMGKILVENFRGIVLYSDTNIEINTSKYFLKIKGEKMSINYMTKEELEISGAICSIEFEK